MSTNSRFYTLKVDALFFRSVDSTIRKQSAQGGEKVESQHSFVRGLFYRYPRACFDYISEIRQDVDRYPLVVLKQSSLLFFPEHGLHIPDTRGFPCSTTDLQQVLFRASRTGTTFMRIADGFLECFGEILPLRHCRISGTQRTLNALENSDLSSTLKSKRGKRSVQSQWGWIKSSQLVWRQHISFIGPEELIYISFSGPLVAELALSRL
jgi:hypothetical protein